MNYTILNKINFPSDVRNLKKKELKKLSEELRQKTIETVSKTGGHLGAGLGVVELTIALHYVFNTPRDKLIWDVGHQAYPHKIITGRKNKIETLRKKNGLYGFVKRAESEYDPFGTAHSSTSVSAGLGIKIAKDINKDNANVICVVGDGALSAGLAYEGLNNAGALKKRLIVILNDNKMSIDKPVGAMSTYLTRLLSSKSYSSLRNLIKKMTKTLPDNLSKTLYRTEEFSKGMLSGGTLFEELGFYYLGPIDGHNVNELVSVLENIRDNKFNKPIFLHCITKKGKGYEPAEKSDDKFHGVEKFDIDTGITLKKTNQKSYSQVFGETLTTLAENDEKIVAITAAMMSGTGLKDFNKKFNNRFFDVGIAEQHAVTMAAGMATEGFKPYVAIYSTFLQRAYDQIVHDVAIQKLPVRFAIDRAGQVGSDGPTHAGSFDLTYLSTLPNFIVMAPSSQSELVKMIKTSALINDFPSAFRYPRGVGNLEEANDLEAIDVGKGHILIEGDEVAILNLGTRLEVCKEASKILNNNNIYPTLADARFAKPLDTNLIDKLLENHKYLVTIEEGSIGGFASHVLNYIHNVRIKKTTISVKNIFFPDKFIGHMKPEEQYEEIKMDTNSIVQKISSLYDDKIIEIKNFNLKKNK
jgi:1-deoxy-D-xylulose-5-phosphate synthase